MKLLTFVHPATGADRVGALMADARRVLDLRHAAELLGAGEPSEFADMLALIDGGEPALKKATSILADAERTASAHAATHEIDQLRLRAPVPVPRQIRDCLVFEKHLIQAMEGGRRLLAKERGDTGDKPRYRVPDVWYKQPIYYKSNRFSVIGHGDDVIWPRYSKLLDFELEFGIFLSRTGKNIQRDAAKDHIFGYTIFNDISARDAQFLEMQGSLAPPRARISTPAISSARGSSPPTKFPIRTT